MRRLCLLLLIAAVTTTCELGPPDTGQVDFGEFSMDVYEFPNKRRARPKHNVSFDEAQAACEGVGKRLCTLWEWQLACQGEADRRFPYGETYNDAACHTAIPIQGHTSTGAAVGLSTSGAYADCKSADGVYDLSGNLEEWVDGYHNGERGILMGGAWYTFREYTDCTGNYSRAPIYRMRPREKVFSAGFRCCEGPAVSEEDVKAWAEEQAAIETAEARRFEPDPEGMVDLGTFQMDRYEYPNRAGAPPLVHVDWEEAAGLCGAVGKRLCTGDEWEGVCRAGGGEWPYGPLYQEGICNTEGEGVRGAGSFPGCKSAAGVFDLSGNVWEWTAEAIDLGEQFGEDHDRRVVRGGAWYDRSSGTSCSYSKGYFAADPRYGYRDVGFRCCRDAGVQGGVVVAPVLGPGTADVRFELGGGTAPGASPAGEGAVVAAAEPPADAAAVEASQAQRKQDERVVQASRQGCPRDMVRAGGVCIDLFEYPNKLGEVPTTGVTVDDARELCEAQERRLCTAAEWMGACTGPTNQRWPYGDAYDREACNYGFTGGRGGVAPAGSKTACVSDYGVLDLSGNVWEWVADVDAEGKAQMYGGYWNLGATYGKCNTVASATQEFRHMSVGFRCCRDPVND